MLTQSISFVFCSSFLLHRERERDFHVRYATCYGKQNICFFLLVSRAYINFNQSYLCCDFNEQFDDIGHHGTKIVIYNLWHNDGGDMELDFELDEEVCIYLLPSTCWHFYFQFVFNMLFVNLLNLKLNLHLKS